MIDATLRGWLEASYFVLGGLGLFMLALASLLAATSKRGVPQLRTGTVHDHIGPERQEDCRSSLAKLGTCMWKATLEVTNIGNEFLVVQHGGIRTADGDTFFSGKNEWMVGGEMRSGPFSLAPGEIAMFQTLQSYGLGNETDTMQVNLLVRRRFGRVLREAYMRNGPSGMTGEVTYGTS